MLGWENVDHAEIATCVGGVEEERVHGARKAIGEDRGVVFDEGESMVGDLAAGGFGTLDEETRVGDQVFAELVEVCAWRWTLEGGDQIAAEEVSPRGGRDWIDDGGQESGGSGFEEGEGFGDGG